MYVLIPSGTQVLTYQGAEAGWQPYSLGKDHRVDESNLWQPNDEKFHEAELDAAMLNFLKKSTEQGHTAIKLTINDQDQWVLARGQFQLLGVVMG
jgi:hypothetical protein